VSLEAPIARSAGAEEAVRALVGLGYAAGAADDAVRAALADGGSQETSQLIRRALQQLAAARGGR
jgi:Holliday junction resolvasome RuvABC DNA-binding subunit